MTAEAIEIKLPDLTRVALEEGDAILVRVSGGRLSMDEAERINQKITAKLPGHEVLVVSGDIELAVLRPNPPLGVEWINVPPIRVPSPRVHVPAASQLRGRIMVMLNQATSEPGHRMSLPMVALGNEIWHTVVAHLAEHGVELGMPHEVEQSIRWKNEHGR